MEYKVEPLELKIGKGVNIDHCGKNYIYVNCRDNFTLRIFNLNEEYQGMLFRFIEFKEDIEYPLFKEVLDRLAQFSGEQINNGELSYADYMDSTIYVSFEQELKSIDAKIRINANDLKEFPEKAKSFLTRATKGELKSLTPIVDKFLQSHDNLEKNKDNQKKVITFNKFLDVYFALIEELIPHTPFQRGFSITYNNPKKEKIIDLFSNILEKPV
ncbi:MAG: hypothetical protein ISS23_01045 [Nanoarchaeota archaeon]|nr:hypothetical protein [Nanoarchaeota archaeon]